MEHMPDFTLHRPTTVDAAIAAKRDNESAVWLGGGTDLLVNMRRGLVPAAHVIDLNGIEELNSIKARGDGLWIGGATPLKRIIDCTLIQDTRPVIAQAAAEVAGPTHQRMGTLAGNLCLDTRCIYYNQSDWWRTANDYCLKYNGDICHVAPKSKTCFAAYSGDVAPALIIMGAEAELAGPDGRRRIPLADLYREDGQAYLALNPGELLIGVEMPAPPPGIARYQKVRVRESIDFPLAGSAVLLHRDGDAIADLRIALTGTNSRPLAVQNLDTLVGGPLDDAAAEKLTRLVNKQISPMKSTSSPSTYRRAVATNLSVHLARELWNEAA